MRITVYTFEDASGSEFGSYQTLNVQKAREYGMAHSLRVIANTLTLEDCEVAEDYTDCDEADEADESDEDEAGDTAECVECGESKPVCCDTGTLDDGTHLDPTCVDCCGPHTRPSPDRIYSPD